MECFGLGGSDEGTGSRRLQRLGAGRSSHKSPGKASALNPAALDCMGSSTERNILPSRGIHARKLDTCTRCINPWVTDFLRCQPPEGGGGGGGQRSA